MGAPRSLTAEHVEYQGVLYHRYPDYPRRSPSARYFMSGGRGNTMYLHRMVWADHNGPIPKGHHIHHKDGDTTNNDISNLECLSASAHSKMLRSKRIEFVCVMCGETFMAAQGRDAKYCSQPCTARSQQTAEHNQEDRMCPVCGVTFTIYKHNKSVCCSAHCAGLHGSDAGMGGKVCFRQFSLGLDRSYARHDTLRPVSL